VTPLEFVAVVLVCATLITCTWIVAERWYVHRDRAYQRLVASAEVSTRLAVEEVQRAAAEATTAMTDLTLSIGTRVGTVEGTVSRLEQAEQERAREKAFGRRT
jgi:predicted metalloprotease